MSASLNCKYCHSRIAVVKLVIWLANKNHNSLFSSALLMDGVSFRMNVRRDVHTVASWCSCTILTGWQWGWVGACMAIRLMFKLRIQYRHANKCFGLHSYEAVSSSSLENCQMWRRHGGRRRNGKILVATDCHKWSSTGRRRRMPENEILLKFFYIILFKAMHCRVYCSIYPYPYSPSP